MIDQCVHESLVEAAQLLAADIRASKLSIVTAESCTGGLLASVFSHVEGASDFLQGGFVACTKIGKASMLGVWPEILSVAGCVSETVACQMAVGALSRCPADLAVAITGNLETDDDEDGNPGGLVYFALMRRDGQPRPFKCGFAGLSRGQMLRQITFRALELIERELPSAELRRAPPVRIGARRAD